MRALQTASGTPIANQGGDRAAAARTRHGRPAKALLLGVALVCWGLDQSTKAIVVAQVDPARPIRLVGGLLTVHLVRNAGAAFSLGENYTIVFTTLSALVLMFVLVGLLPRVTHIGWAVALGFLCGGILGNLTDRVVRPPSPLRGHVVDFLQLPHWAIFNVADMCVCTAAVMIMIFVILKNVTLTGQPAGGPKEPVRVAQTSISKDSISKDSVSKDSKA